MAEKSRLVFELSLATALLALQFGIVILILTLIAAGIAALL